MDERTREGTGVTEWAVLHGFESLISNWSGRIATWSVSIFPLGGSASLVLTQNTRRVTRGSIVRLRGEMLGMGGGGQGAHQQGGPGTLIHGPKGTKPTAAEVSERNWPGLGQFENPGEDFRIIPRRARGEIRIKNSPRRKTHWVTLSLVAPSKLFDD